MPIPAFAVTFDYRCPFARIAHEHVVTGLQGDAGWDVRFVPLSLSQLKVEPGGTDVWDAPGTDSGLLALEMGVAVRDTQPDKFLAAHIALFDLRHAQGGDLRDPAQLQAVLEGAGVDVDAVLEELATGVPRKTVREEHEWAVAEHGAWGVPTFMVLDQAVFVRLMDHPTDVADATKTVERLVDLSAGWPALNEFKHTRLPR
jgi:hypothetical protein